MQPKITGTLIYLPESYLPPAWILSGAVERLTTQFPEAPIWIATHDAGQSQAISGLLNETPAGASAKRFAPESIRSFAKPGGSVVECLREIFADMGNAASGPQGDGATADDSQDTIAICYGWYASLDLNLTADVLNDHAGYLAHFTYSENIPAGFVPDFVSRDFVAALQDPLPPELARSADAPESQSPSRSKSGDLRAFAFKNIDRFDVELFYRGPDLRQYRLDLTATGERSSRLMTEIDALNSGLVFADLEGILKSNPEILRPYPAYFEVELSARFIEPDFAPGTLPSASADVAASRAAQPFLSDELLAKLKDDIAQHGLTQDVAVSFAGAGEPCLHPRFLEIVSDFLNSTPVQQVIIETYGAGVDPDLVRALFALPSRERITVIVRMDSLRPERYTQLYGADQCAAALEFLELCERGLRENSEGLVPAVYVEMHRLAETEDELTEFMDRFDQPEQPIQPLLQKYNRYIDRLPERRAADLTPLTREFCWHLARDLYLTVDGRVPVCKQDPYGENPATLDFATASVTEIFAKTRSYHNASVRGEHDAIPMACLQCDEWYTFNA